MIKKAVNPYGFSRPHLLGIEGLSPPEIVDLLDRAEDNIELGRQPSKKRDSLTGRTQINLFFENSTRTQSSFELAGKRLGADVMNMAVGQSSVKKGETLIDTAMTLNAMNPDVIVVRHNASGAVALLAQKVDCSVVNAGDGSHEHPTQALLDALTIAATSNASTVWSSPFAAMSPTAASPAPTCCCSPLSARASASSARQRWCPVPSARWASRSSPRCARG